MGQLGRPLLLGVQVERSRDLGYRQGLGFDDRPPVNSLGRPARARDGGRAAKRLESHVPDPAFAPETRAFAPKTRACAPKTDLHPNQGALLRPPGTAGADILGVERQRPEEPGRPEVIEEDIGGTVQGCFPHGPASARLPRPRRSSQ